MSPPALQLIGRADELGLVDQAMRQLQAGEPAAQWIVALNGEIGMGKSALLRALAERWAASPLVEAVLVDCAAHGGEVGLDEAKRSFLAQCQAGARPGSPLHQVVSLLERSEPGDEHALTEGLARIFEKVRPSDPPLLLLLDSCGRSTAGLMAWVERLVLRPLLPTGRMLVVAASRAPISWHSHELRERTLQRSLRPLSRGEIDQLAGDGELGELVYGLSYGHPLAASVALERAAAQGGASWLRANQAEVAGAAVAAILARVEPPLSPEHEQLVRVMALLRAYDAVILDQVARPLVPALAGYNQLRFLQVIKRLAGSGLAALNEAARTWGLSRPIRMVIARAAELRDPRQYAAAREHVLYFYTQSLAEGGGDAEFYLIEMVYQQLQRPEAAPAWYAEIPQRFGQSVRKAFAPGAAGAELAALRQRIEADLELQVALEARGLTLAGLLAALDECTR